LKRGCHQTTSELGKRPAEGKVKKKSAKKQKANGKEVFTPKKEWMARKREGRCLRCGQPGHVMAECKNPKSAEPFVALDSDSFVSNNCMLLSKCLHFPSPLETTMQAEVV